jgi:hypothetical protein
MQKYFFISFLFSTLYLLQAQTVSENWVPVLIEKDRSLFVNVSGLSNFAEDEIYVWSLQEMNLPMTMEEVNGDIYKVRTYYHINREINRYSILQIVFYDVKDNVLKQYSYEHKSDKPEFKFNYPIIRNSEVNKIFSKCLEYMSPSNEKK